MNGTVRIADRGLRIGGPLRTEGTAAPVTRARTRTRSTPRVHNPKSTIRNAFTLVELLVAITIFLILTGMTIVMVTNLFEAERLRSGARQVQSYLEGARDRAIYADAPRGVRFLFDDPGDPTDPRSFTVNSMVFVKPLDPDEGICDIAMNMAMPPEPTIVTLQPPGPFTWDALAQAGVLTADSRIRISAGNGAGVDDADDGLFYGLDAAQTFDPTDGTLLVPGTLFLSSPHISGLAGTDFFYSLELANGVLPNSEPTILPRNIVIHLRDDDGDLVGDVSSVPASWLANRRKMDLMFSPRGQVAGAPAAQGIIHLVICDLEDVPDGTNTADDKVWTFFQLPNGTAAEQVAKEQALVDLEGGLLIATIFTRTGLISTNDPDPVDPFRYALTGEVTGE